MTTPTHGLQLRSIVKTGGELQLSLVNIETPSPGPDEIVVRIQATPINPSDIGLLFGAADMTTAKVSGSATQPIITASVPERFMKGMAGRLDQSMPVGNEGAGLVVATGSSDTAKALMGKTVAVLGGAMYSQYRTVPLSMSLLLPEGASAADGASCFVNPLTALGMVETMRREGHTALVHTAAASNLGQMLNKICIKDGIKLVNIVRKPEQAALLKSIGANYVCDQSSPSFMEDLTQALVKTGATVAFDATTPKDALPKAENKTVIGSINTQTGEVAFEAAVKNFSFSNPKVQEHFNGDNWFKSNTYPVFSYTGTIEKLSKVKFKKDGVYNVTVNGEMKIRDVSRKEKVEGTITIAGGKITVAASFVIELDDYNIKGGSIDAGKVAKQPKVTATAEF